MDKWTVVAEPVGANPALKPDAPTRQRKTGGKDDKNKDNVGGVVVSVQKAGRRPEEVARVGFVRGTSENPNVSFSDKLDEVVQVAEKTAATLNKLTPDGELQ